jgi:homoserine O-acetyltransferase
MSLENRYLENEYYTQDEHGDFELFDLGDFNLARGQTLPDAKLAYQTFGDLNEDKDNVILIRL